MSTDILAVPTSTPASSYAAHDAGVGARSVAEHGQPAASFAGQKANGKKPSGAFKSLSNAVGPELAQALLMVELGVGKMSAKMDSVKNYSALKGQVQQEQDRKVVTQMEKAAKAAKTGLLAKIFGWIAKIFMLVASVVTAVATFGVASPLMAAAIASMVLLAAYDVASSAAMEANKGLHIGLADGLGKMVGGLAKLCGASDEEVKKAEQWGGMALAMVVQIALSVGVLAPGAASKAVSEAGRLLTDLGEFFVKLGTQPGKVLGESFKALGGNLPLLRSLLDKMPKTLKPLDEAAEAGAQASARAASSAAQRATSAGDEAAEAGAAATEAAIKGKESLSNLQRYSTNLQEGVGYLTAATALGQGITQIINGDAQYKAGLAEADAIKSMALVSWLEAVFDKQKDELEYLAKEQSGMVKKTQDMATDKAETDSVVVSNFGSGGGAMGASVGFA